MSKQFVSKAVTYILATIVIGGMFYYFVLTPENKFDNKIGNTPKTKNIYGF